MEHRGFAAFIDEPPIIEITGGIARISYHHETIGRVMSVRTLTRAMERAQKALRLHAAGEQHIMVDD